MALDGDIMAYLSFLGADNQIKDKFGLNPYDLMVCVSSERDFNMIHPELFSIFQKNHN